MRIRGDEFFELATPGEMSPDQQWAVDASACHRTLWFPNPSDDELNDPVDDDDRHFAAQSLLGYNVMKEQDVVSAVDFTFGKRRWIERVLPHSYPATLDPNTNPFGRPYLFAQSIPKCEAVTRHSAGAAGPFGDGGPLSRDGVKFYLNYRTLPYDLREDAEVPGASPGPLGPNGQDGNWRDRDGAALLAQPDEGHRLSSGWKNTRFVIKNEEDRSVMITLPQGLLTFFEANPDGTRDPVPSGYPFTNTCINLTYEWCLVPIDAIPRVAIANALNCVNNQTFDGYPRGTLLFKGYRIANHRGPFGDWLCNILYGFSFRPNYDFDDRGPVPGEPTAMGWNSWPRVKGIPPRLRYDLAMGAGMFGVGSLVYPLARMDALLRPDQEMPV